MRIINSFHALDALCARGSFDLEDWRRYIRNVKAGLEELCVQDMQKVLDTGKYSFETHYLPVLEQVYKNSRRRSQANQVFTDLSSNLKNSILTRFGRCPQADLVFYLGLCNGAGWVTEVEGNTCILLGIEKIMELGWDNPEDMQGLLYHEIGHAYHMQFGRFYTPCKNTGQQFLWQLFTEGVAMCFEQLLVNDQNYYHKDKDGWAAWCGQHLPQIKRDFAADLPGMTYAGQRWFGDWVHYQGRGDVGYYLGCQFVHYILTELPFDQIICLDIRQVEVYFERYINS